MTPWKLYCYSPELDVFPVRDWYEDQQVEVKAAFDTAIHYFCANDDWDRANGVRMLDGRFCGLHEILVTVDLDDGERQFGAIGKYKTESNEFVLFLVCDRYNDSYFACLDRALDYAQAWERDDLKGDTYAYDLE